MITVEVPLRSIQTQREALMGLAPSVPSAKQPWLDGALAVLWWLEHGGDTPLEMAVQEACG